MTRIGYAAGAFDLFHVGHLNILKHAKSRCDFLIAGVVSDEMLELNKGITPVVPLAERLEIVSHISYVDQARAEGELLIRGPQVFQGYWRRPDETRA
ncbi:adenylyltransferase/cytidyltransferase family protein, partial [Clavibacter michiganensis]|uniref:adenylyltransferase/cytidyltransferase family protein n=1 Tax=Clavibacter michiganensis TaxID=28447 RepID=UPI0021750F31